MVDDKKIHFILFHTLSQDVQKNIDRILKVAERLKDMQFFDVELIDRLYIKLESEWKKLYCAVERRTAMLQASISFHRHSEKVRRTQLLYFYISRY